MNQKQYIRIFRQKVKDSLKFFRRTVRTSFKSPTLAIKYLNFRSNVRAYNWNAAKLIMNDIAEEAYKVRDSRLLKEMSHSAMRFLDLDSHLKWASKCEILDGNTKKTDWRGEDLSGATLCISFRETEKQGLAVGLSLTGYVHYVSQQAKYTILIVEKRLVPIFASTLANVRVVAGPTKVSAISGTYLVTANPLILKTVIGLEQKTIDSLYMPFATNADRVKKFRSKYEINTNMPIIGIAWGSFSLTKSEAPIECWIDLVKSINAIFIVMQYQYDGFNQDLDALMLSAPGRIIFDSSVDQLVDMDIFADQAASLDLVVSTMGTPAHFSGAVGVSTYTVCDDLFRRACPVNSFNKIPWYPEAYLYGKNGRNWISVFDDLKNDINKLNHSNEET
jgi:hypothetical protein